MSGVAELQEELSRAATALMWACRDLEASARSPLLGNKVRSQEHRRALAHVKAAQQSVKALLDSVGQTNIED